MPHKKMTAFTAVTTVAADDIMIIDDTSAVETKKVTLENLLSVINALTVEATVDGAADYIAVWDTSASAIRKVLPNDLPVSTATTAAIAAAVVGLYDHKGAYDASTNSPDLDTSPSGILKGDAYTVSVAGTFFAVSVEAGDVLIADQDSPTLATHWTIVNKNIDSSAFAAASHTHATSDITSGTFADARIAESNVTQHEAALTITESQISDLGSYSTTGHAHAASDITSGTLAHERGGIEADISGVAIGDILAGTGSGTIGIVTSTGHSDGDVLTLQADGTVDFETPAASGLTAADIDTLAELNAIVTDATLIDTADSRLSDNRDPNSHNHSASEITSGTLTHERGGLEFDASAVAIGDVIAGTGSGTMGLVTSTGHSDGDVLTIQADGTVDFETPAGGSSLPVADTTGIAKGSADATKIVRLEVDGLTTATTRTLTVQDTDGTIALIGGNTYTGVHDFGGATSIEIPNGAAPTVNAAGEIAVDTTITDYTGMIKYHDGTEELTGLAVPTANLSTTDGEVVAYNATNNELEFIDVVGPYLDSTLGGAASGDILYHDGTNWTNLAKGTDGEVLTLASGLPAWGDNGGISTLTDGATVTVDGDKLAVQRVTLGGNRTLAFTNFREGQRVCLRLTQDGTGSRTVTWPSSGVTINWAGGSAPTLTTTASKADWIVLICTDDTGGAEIYDAALAMENV